jgi:Tfp pilus assembly major pilin PilA
MTLGQTLLIMIGVILILSILLKEWVNYEKKKNQQGMQKRRRLFRKR